MLVTLPKFGWNRATKTTRRERRRLYCVSILLPVGGRYRRRRRSSRSASQVGRCRRWLSATLSDRAVSCRHNSNSLELCQRRPATDRGARNRLINLQHKRRLSSARVPAPSSSFLSSAAAWLGPPVCSPTLRRQNVLAWRLVKPSQAREAQVLLRTNILAHATAHFTPSYPLHLTL